MLRHVFVREIKPHKKWATTLHSAKQAAPDMRMLFAYVCVREKREMEKVNSTEVYYSLVNNRGHLVLFLCVLPSESSVNMSLVTRSSSMISSTNMLHESHLKLISNEHRRRAKNDSNILFSFLFHRLTRPGRNVTSQLAAWYHGETSPIDGTHNSVKTHGM